MFGIPATSPAQKTISLDNGFIIFDSNFDSGNLARVERMSEYKFHLWPGND